VCLAFPLHLPGRPEKSRLSELLAAAQPRLVLQGSKDSFGTGEEIRAAIGGLPGIAVVDLPGADHSYRIAARSAASGASNRTGIARRRAEEEGVDNASPSVSDDEVGGIAARSAASGASNRTETARSTPFTPVDLRTTLVTEISRFIGAVTGITTP
jgi:hypothetical protein